MDLSNSQSWQLVISGNKQITNIRKYASVMFYDKIPEFRVRVVSPIISVNLSSETAKPTWFLGAWAKLYVPARGTTYMMTDDSKQCRLNDETLLIFNQSTEQIPYALSLSFPWYLEDVSYQIWQYIDESGRYFSSELERLSELIEGQEITLSNVSYSQSPDAPDLIISTFSEPVRFDRFEVGRFRYIGTSQTVSDPIIRAETRRLIAIFTGAERVQPNTVKVTVTPIK